MFLPSHIEMNSRFIVMTIDESHLGSTISRHGPQHHLLILSVETLRVRLEVLQ